MLWMIDSVFDHQFVHGSFGNFALLQYIKYNLMYIYV